MKQRVSSCLAFIVVLQLILIGGQAELFVVTNKIIKTTQSNATTLAEHSTKLAKHEQNFQQILEGTFSPEFANKVRKYLPNEQTK